MLGDLISLLSATLRISTPLTLSAIGGTFSERSGVINIGLEGMILIGAFSAVAATYYTQNPWIGVLFAIFLGGMLAFVHALLSIKFKANQVVSGVGVNIFALGFTTLMMQIIWGNRGASEGVQGLKTISIPVLSQIPVAGEIFKNQSPLVFVMLAIVVLSHIVLFKTPLGLRIRAVGEHPEAADTVGIDVYRVRYFCVILSGMFSGLGGAYLSLSQMNVFSQNMSAGRGFIALAANIFGKWTPLGSFGASLLFAFTDALQMKLQGSGVPFQFIQMIPYILTILVLAGAVRRAVPPAAIGKPYEKGGK
ncbi:MAG: ABC transporter permease [Candidatus Methanofastidiosia archaeon]